MSAMPDNVLPMHNDNTPSLDDLVQKLIAAKVAEDNAKKARIDAEEAILARVTCREEGSETTATDSGFKITTTGSLSYKATSVDAVRAICKDWPNEMIPLKQKVELDATGCKYIRANRPDLWEQLARVVTITPAKASVKVGV